MRGKGFSENRGFSLFFPHILLQAPVFVTRGQSSARALGATPEPSHAGRVAFVYLPVEQGTTASASADGWQGRPGCGSRARCPLLAGAALDPRPERAPHVPPVTAALRVNGEPSFRCAHEAAGGLQASRVVWGGRVGSTHQMPGHSKTRSALIL